MDLLAVARRFVAGVAFLSCAVVAHAGIPLIVVEVDQPCEPPADMACQSGASGRSGALQLDLEAQGVLGVPGAPVSIVFHYDSASSDGRTSGASVRLRAYAEDRAGTGWLATHVKSAGVDIARSDGSYAGGSARRVGFDSTIAVCNPYHSTEIPLGSVAEPLPMVPPFDPLRSSGGGLCDDQQRHDNTQWQAFEVTIPVKVDGSQTAALPCPAPVVDGLSGGGLFVVRPQMTLKTSSGDAHVVYCSSSPGAGDFPVFLAPTKASPLSMMGPNWSHNYSGYIQRYQTNTTTGAVTYHVVHASDGGFKIYQGSDAEPPPGVERELPRARAELGCTGCEREKLLRVTGGYALQYGDGSRRHFTRTDRTNAARALLARIEERNKRNATTLEHEVSSWGATVLTRIVDAGGMAYEFAYDDFARRLKTVTFPGGRVYTLGYDAEGRLETFSDPEASAGSGAPVRYRYVAPGNPRIASKQLGDEETVTYEYYGAPATGEPDLEGRLKSATLGPTTGPLINKTSYSYSDPVASTQRWSMVTPPDPTTAMVEKRFYHPTNGEHRVEVMETRPTCDPSRPPAQRCGTDTLIDYEWDHLGRLLTTKRRLRSETDTWRFQTTCLLYQDEDSDLVRAVRGPVCLSVAELSGRSEPCDEMDLLDDNACPADLYEWETEPYVRVRSVIPANQHAWLPHQRKSWRYFYGDDANPSDADADLAFTCHPEDVDCREPVKYSWEDASTVNGRVRRLKTVSDGNGDVTTYEYEPDRSILIAVTNPESNVLKISRDAKGFVSTVSGPGGTEAYAWNERGQVTQHFIPSDSSGLVPTTEMTYTRGGKLKTVRDVSRNTQWVFDYRLAPFPVADGLLHATRRVSPGTNPGDPPIDVTYGTRAYDVAGRMSGFTTRGLDTYQLSRDPRGLVQRVEHVSGPGPYRLECFSTEPFNGSQVLSSHVPWRSPAMPCDETERVRRDRLGRPILEYVRTPDVGGGWRLSEMLTLYDDDGYPKQWSSNVGGFPSDFTWFERDATGRIARTDIGRGSGAPVASIVYTYTPDHRIETMTDVLSDSSLAFEYRPNGLVRSKVFRDRGQVVATEEYEYDGAQRPSRVVREWHDEALTRTILEITHDTDGQVCEAKSWREHHSAPCCPHGIDGVKPLDLFHVEYEYDGSFNMTARHDRLAGTSEFFTILNEERIAGRTYDGNGNMTSDGQGGTYTYDGMNRLYRSVRGGVATTHHYNPWGRLIASTSNGETTVNQYLEWDLLHTYTPGRSEADVTFARDGNGLFGHYTPSTSLAMLDQDIAGSLKNAGGEDFPTYDPFGRRLEGRAHDMDTALGFQGQQLHAPTGLYYMRNRWYDPTTARFTSPDPMVQDAVNNYSFVYNSPYRFWDPLGLDRFVHVVGDHPSAGRNFDRVSDTMAEQRRNAGHTVDIVRADTLAGFNAALTGGGLIDGGVSWFGHANADLLSFADRPGFETNLNDWQVPTVPGSNLGPNAVVELFGCNTGNGADSMAALLAQHLGRQTFGSTTGMGFTGVPGQYDYNKFPPETGPLYMVPAPGGRFIPFDPPPPPPPPAWSPYGYNMEP